MTNFKTSKAELLFVKTYSEVNTANLQKLRSSWIHFFADGITVETNLLPQGNWQLIGKLSEVSEEVAKGLVDEDVLQETDLDMLPIAPPTYHYWDYTTQHKLGRFTSAIPSLNSIATHLGLDTNDNIYLLKKI
jgi:hypothetical protein